MRERESVVVEVVLASGGRESREKVRVGMQNFLYVCVCECVRECVCERESAYVCERE